MGARWLEKVVGSLGNFLREVKSQVVVTKSAEVVEVQEIAQEEGLNWLLRNPPLTNQTLRKMAEEAI